jgi:competence protein ComFC
MPRCLLCKRVSFSHICKVCQNQFLAPTLSTRVIGDGFKVFSFYNYHDIAPLLKTKHTYIGAAIYKILADNAFKKFSQNFHFDSKVYAIGIDDHSKHGYAHTAILTRALKSRIIKPLYGALRAKNSVRYSAQSLAYRMKHKRDFFYHDSEGIDVILVDDIITTGTTILEAKNVLEKSSVTPIFALTLADAREL